MVTRSQKKQRRGRSALARPSQEAARAMSQPLPEVPQRFREVEAWLVEHGERGWLDLSIRVLEPWFHGGGFYRVAREHGGTTLGDCLSGWGMRSGSPVSALRRELIVATRSHLGYLAQQRRLDRLRSERWSRPLDDARLAETAHRLAGLLAEVRQCEASRAPVPYERARITFIDFPPSVAVAFTGTGRWDQSDDQQTIVELEPRPDGRLRWSCEREGEPWADDDDQPPWPAEPCPHLRVLLEWILDWLHDPQSGFHAPLVELLSRPGWSRLIAHADRIIEQGRGRANRQSGSDPDRELAWRLGVDPQDGLLEIVPVMRTRGKSGRFGRGRKVDPAGLMSEREVLSPQDERALRLLSAIPMSIQSFFHDLPTAAYQAEALLELVGHPRIFRLDRPTEPLRIVEGRPTLRLARQAGRYGIQLHLGDRPLPWERFDLQRIGRHLLFQPDAPEGVFRLARLEDPAGELLELLAGQPPLVPDEGVGELVRVLAAAQPGLDLELPADLAAERRRADGACRLRLAPLGETGLEAWLKARPDPDGPTWPPGRGPERIVAARRGRLVSTERDLAAERRAAGDLCRRLDLEPAAERDPWHWRLPDPERALALVAAAQQLGDELDVDWPEDQAPWKVSTASPQNVRVRLRSKRSWFQVDGALEVDGERIGLAELLDRVRSGQRFLPIGAGRFALIGERLRRKLERIDSAVMPGSRGGLKAGSGRAAALQQALDDLPVEADEHWSGLIDRLRAAADLKPRKPTALAAELRPYQTEGFRWLARLAAWAQGACLADDMGLGKTVQALGLLLRRAKQGPALVIAPSSVGSVWLTEAARFAPSLELRHYHGPDRHGLLAGLGPGDLLVTSYDVMARDVEALAGIAFATVVLDEAQYVKNTRSKRARAVRRLQAGFRLAMTGTPLENHLGELWSVFRCVDPGLLGSWEYFRDRFAAPIERDHDPRRRDELVRLLRPFLLRRTKAQVAPELPPRTEVIRPVEMKADERRVYRRLQREVIEGLAARDTEPEGRFALLAAITRMRRLACHPRLVYPDSRIRSSKLEAASALLESLLADGQRALVFSQFTSHLALVREVLDERGQDYLYLDGATPAVARTRLVDAWATGAPGLFLISLKAGGSGLNLTGADAVIHLDPWWNPAVEDQATDRTHRIGQTRPVTVVRLIVQQTIEEAVLDLHASKRELASGLLEGADAAGGLSSQELLGLLRFGQSAAR
jgi:superfamily II DNA or RNA helicase